MSKIRLLLLGWLVCEGASSAASPTRIDVRTFPPGARVTLDGKPLRASDSLFVVPPGSAGIAVEADGYRREVRQIEIPPQQITRVELPLRKQPHRSDRRPGGIAASPKPARDHGDMRRAAAHHGPVIVLPPADAGTPLSYQIDAQSDYCARYGSMVESLANARKIDAEAVAKEIQNSIDAVDAAFKRRELNKFYRRYELDPQEREARLQERLKRNVTELYQKTLHGNVTPTLNWLLQELVGPTIAYQYLPGNQKLANSQLDQELPEEDLKLIRLTDGGGRVLAANSGAMLDAHWPVALRAAEFEQLRQQFETTRDEVVEEAKNTNQINDANEKKLQESVIALMVALEAAYPEEIRVDSSRFLLYITAKRFLLGLRARVHRAATTTDLAALSDKQRFQGGSLVALLQHMYRSGLEFAPPEQAGEGVYKRLFQGMRILYMNIGAVKADPDVARP